MTKSAPIILADYDATMRERMEVALRAQFHPVVTTGDAAVLEAMLRQGQARVLVLGAMPLADTIRATRAMLDEVAPRVRLIALVQPGSAEAVRQAFLHGADDVLARDSDTAALLASVENVLASRPLKETALTKADLGQLHQALIERSPDMIFIIDRNGRFSFVNERAETLLALDKSSLLGSRFLDLVTSDARASAERCINEALAGKEPKPITLWLSACGDNLSECGEKLIAVEFHASPLLASGEEKETRSHGVHVVARDITKRLESERLIHYQAYHDLLTGLPNRALFLDRLNVAINSAKRRKAGLSVMFLDLDRFKLVNDTLGHSVGDKLLQQVAARLKSNLREADTLARLGGDEFIVMLPTVENQEIAEMVAAKLIGAVKEPFEVDDHELFITGSVGIALYPRDGDNAEDLIKHADIAMYHTKDDGKDGFNLYDSAMSIRREKILGIENEIRRGIKENQFEVHYQPQVGSFSGEITGVEALLRWQHPQRGLVSPDYFLDVAEEAGLMVELGDWVLNKALEDVQCWRQQGVRLEKLAINFSARQIEQKDFVERILRALQAHDYPASALEIEVTERALLSDLDTIIAKLRRLAQAGVDVAIDDFGTGYSSLSLLRQLPIKRLKIDKSFIQAVTDDNADITLLEAIVHMGKGLKLDMVAEGVEKDLQLLYLQHLQCPVVQGYLYGRAKSARETLDLFRSTGRFMRVGERVEQSA